MRIRLGALACCVAFSGAWTWEARADDAVASAQEDVVYVSRQMGSVRTAIDHAKTERQTAEQRLADGELLFRMNDYNRAIVVLSEILEEFPGTATYPDALWLRGETYYAARDYRSARRDYQALVDHGQEPRFQTYLGRALARLVDVSLRLDDPPESLAPLFQKFAQVPPSQVDAALMYAEGKAYYRQRSWGEATQALSRVPNGTPYTHQARYFQGVVAMKMAQSGGGQAGTNRGKGPNYDNAIAAFRAVTELPPDTPDHRHVIDLAWMAVGRLLYETDRYEQAAKAYANVGRDSPEFDTALYELAWVYVRLGDVGRAERSLEVLMVTDPNSQFVGDGTLLRADLLLRAGAFDRALQLYQSVLAHYEPMRAKVDAFLDSTKDVSVYYDKLAQQELSLLDGSAQLPPIAIRWAREAEDGPLAFAVVDDINECKTLAGESSRLIDKLTALTSASNRAHAFPELEAGEESALGLLNRISRARFTLARALDEEEPSALAGELGEVRQQRRALMARVQRLPVGPEDFALRGYEGLTQWNALSQKLKLRSLEVDTLQATINGLRRVLRDGPQQGVARDPASVARFEGDIDANASELRADRDAITELRRQVELGRAQIGLGDARYQQDATAREQFRELLEREVQMASGGAAGDGAQRLAVRAAPVMAQALEYESALVSELRQFESQVAQRAGQLQQRIDVERVALAGYQQRLGALDGDARDLVGRVAERNFGLVRDKLRGILLRADVGLTEQAWEVREEELDRVRSLQSERARQEQLLDEELKEVRDDGVEPGQPNAQ